MRSINLEACEVMKKILEGLSDRPGSNKKIDNADGVFMYLAVELVGNVPNTGTGQLISLAHYYEQNGDLMRDPEMIFWEGADAKGNTRYYPSYYLQDAVGVEQNSIIFDFEKLKCKGFYRTMQKDQALFANTWMKNIEQQQGL